MRFQYELAQNSQFVLKDRARALAEYRLLLRFYPTVVDVWRAVAAQVPSRWWPSQVRAIQETHVRKLAVAYYNYACLLVADGNAVEAMAALRSSFEYDRSLTNHALEDPDLAPLRSRPDFTGMVDPS